MSNRKGEKLGWIFGWIGSFSWIFILSIVLIFQGETKNCILGLIIVAMAFFFVFKNAPWRKPDVEFWKLFLPILNTVVVSIFWAYIVYRSEFETAFNWWYILLFIPLIIPIFTIGKRKWSDGDKMIHTNTDNDTKLEEDVKS